MMMEETSPENCREVNHPHPAGALQKSSSGFCRSRTQQGQLPGLRCDQNLSFLKKYGTPPSEQELKLAAVAIRLNVRLRTSDMPVLMQEHALRYARSLVGNSAAAAPPPLRLSPTVLARSLKKEFDGRYGPAWHCVVGKSFGSFVTHSVGGFVYFSLDSLSFLLFKTEVQLVKDPPLPKA